MQLYVICEKYTLDTKLLCLIYVVLTICLCFYMSLIFYLYPILHPLHVVQFMFFHFRLNKVNVFCLLIVAVDVSLPREMSMSPSV